MLDLRARCLHLCASASGMQHFLELLGGARSFQYVEQFRGGELRFDRTPFKGIDEQHSRGARRTPMRLVQNLEPRTGEQSLACDQHSYRGLAQGGERLVRAHREIELEFLAQRRDE